MKKLIALLLALFLTVVSTVCFADVLTIDLSAATDEELAAAAAQIKAEQQARLKTSIQLDPAEVTVIQGANQKVTATVLDLPDGVKAGKFEWASSNDAVATCANGTIKGTGAGNAEITCTTVLSDGSEVSAQIKVTCIVLVKSIAFENRKMEVMAGDVFTPSITITPDNATDQTVTLVSSDEKVVRVDENGQLVALLNGKATITATVNDGGKGTAKCEVTVTKKVGKYDDELTFQGLEWGMDREAVVKKLQENGILEAERDYYGYTTNYMYFWPDNDLKFASWSLWRELPVAFRDFNKGAYEMGITPLKKIGGYTPQSTELCFLNPVENGEINTEKTELYGVCLSFDNKHERGADIFVDLLAKMEAQYGEFTRYLAKDLTRSYYKDMYSVISASMEGATTYRYRELGKEIYLNDCAICVLRGKNDTGIMLMIDSSENVTLFYCKTNVLDRINAIEAILKAVPDDKEDAGI